MRFAYGACKYQSQQQYQYNALSRLIKGYQMICANNNRLSNSGIEEQTANQGIEYVWRHDKGVNTYLVSDQLNSPRIGLNQDQTTC